MTHQHSEVTHHKLIARPSIPLKRRHWLKAIGPPHVLWSGWHWVPKKGRNYEACCMFLSLQTCNASLSFFLQEEQTPPQGRPLHVRAIPEIASLGGDLWLEGLCMGACAFGADGAEASPRGMKKGPA